MVALAVDNIRLYCGYNNDLFALVVKNSVFTMLKDAPDQAILGRLFWKMKDKNVVSEMWCWGEQMSQLNNDET